MQAGNRVQVTADLVSYIAELSRIELSGDQARIMEKELGSIINYMDVLSNVNTDGVEPLSHVFAIDNVMRQDTVLPSYDRAELLSNAPEHTDDTVVVPKVVE